MRRMTFFGAAGIGFGALAVPGCGGGGPDVAEEPLGWSGPVDATEARLATTVIASGVLAISGASPVVPAGRSPITHTGSSLFNGPETAGIQQPECPRNAARSFAAGDTTTIEDRRPPCRIEYRRTGIRLEAVSDGSRPDPGRTVLVDSNGRYYSANAPGWGVAISVWDSRGRYMHSFGRAGEGPGELTRRGMLSLYMDGRDNLHVRDGGLQWSVFSPEHEFLRRVPSNVMGGASEQSTFILDDGSALASDGYVRNRSRHFRVVDSTGALARTFGPEGVAGYLDRPITHAGGDTFWAAPPIEGPQEYVLEEWGLDGELRRALRRDVSWYEWRGEQMISSAVSRLHVTRSGLLYVLLPRPTAEFIDEYESPRHGMGPPVEDDEESELMELLEVVIEVIDTRSGELLASEVFRLPQLMETAAMELFRGSLRGYRYEEGDDGLPFVDIMEVTLVPR